MEVNMIQDLDSVVLTIDIPEHDLTSGDIGTVVLVHGGGAGYEVEFATLDGETMAVVTLPAKDIRTIGRHEIAHVRQVAQG